MQKYAINLTLTNHVSQVFQQKCVIIILPTVCQPDRPFPSVGVDNSFSIIRKVLCTLAL